MMTLNYIIIMTGNGCRFVIAGHCRKRPDVTGSVYSKVSLMVMPGYLRHHPAPE
jgi:hypothetical protein